MERPPDARDPEPERSRPDSPDQPDRAAPTSDDEPRQADLLAIGLLVFFVSLIGLVGALLLVPALF